MKRMYVNGWTDAQNQFLRENFKMMCDSTLTEKLAEIDPAIKRTVLSVKAQRNRLGLVRDCPPPLNDDWDNPIPRLVRQGHILTHRIV